MSRSKTVAAVAGAFQRSEAGFRSFVGAEGGEFPAEAGRYHLFISWACPWANRCAAVRTMKGLEHAIGMSVVHPVWQRTRPDDAADGHTGWVFRGPDDEPLQTPRGCGSFAPGGLVPNTVNGARTVRELYELSDDTAGLYSVPVLWDTQTSRIVNNESSEIIRMLNSAFNDFAEAPGLDLYPEPLRAEIDEVNAWVYPTINNGVYRCGFARTQEAYDAAVESLFEGLDRVEEILSRQRYLAGASLTEADIRLFMTLVRFDEVYVVYFKTNCRKVEEYPNMMNYCRELYQAMPTAVNMEHIKMHYFTSHPRLNHFGIIPRGPDTERKLQQPHDRDRSFA